MVVHILVLATYAMLMLQLTPCTVSVAWASIIKDAHCHTSLICTFKVSKHSE